MQERYLDKVFRKLREVRLVANTKVRVINPFDDNYTSELVKLSTDFDDNYLKEYKRRLGLLGLSEEQIQEVYFNEKLTIGKNLKLRKSRPGIRSISEIIGKQVDIRRETMPLPQELTLSELVLVENEVENRIFLDTETDFALLGEKFKIVYDAYSMATSKEMNGDGIYQEEFDLRTKNLRWSRLQRRAFKNNEKRLIERLWYHQDKKINAWIKETIR